MIDKLRKQISLLEKKADFADIRASDSVSDSVLARKGKMESAVSGSVFECSVRVLNKGAFGFASTNDPKRIARAAEEAARLCSFAQKKSMGASLSSGKVSVDSVSIKPRDSILDHSLEEKADEILSLNRQMKSEKSVSFDSSYTDSSFRKYYVSSEGAEIAFESQRSRVLNILYFKDGGKIDSIAEASSGFTGFGVFSENQGMPASLLKRAEELSRAKKPKPGLYNVVLGPKMTGTMAHEAVGHACEADFVLTGESILGGKLGRKIGSGLVNISDSPSSQGNGFFPYDDEGVKTSETVLVKRGVLENYLHSRETAGRMETRSTGNARAQSASSFPLVRMSNLHIKSGESTFDELIDMKEGLYVDGFKGGQVIISTGVYQFASEIGYVIRDGELAEPVRDVAMVGNIMKTLRHVDAVGNDMKENISGSCGKGDQYVPVSESSPSIRVRGVRVA